MGERYPFSPHIPQNNSFWRMERGSICCLCARTYGRSHGKLTIAAEKDAFDRAHPSPWSLETFCLAALCRNKRTAKFDLHSMTLCAVSLVEFPCVRVIDISAAFFCDWPKRMVGSPLLSGLPSGGEIRKSRSRLSFGVSDHKREASSDKMNPLPPVTFDRSNECDRELALPGFNRRRPLSPRTQHP